MMSSESPPARKPRSRTAPRTPESDGPSPTLRGVDALLVGVFLALTFLLGVFPMKDTDFWWHLRTGDLIRQTGRVPTTDLYTFSVPDRPWIDLHWGYQVALSWGHALGGVPALNLAKCAISTLAVLLLVTSRRRDWPVWVMLLAWLPALLVLSGRMYVRPETLSLLYLAAYLAILFRWERFPLLALFLPLIQVAWVNSHGLFVLGPIVLGFALIQAVLRPGSFAPERRRWWRFVGVAMALTAAACFLNPYGLSGAFYPLELARTMGNPVFSNSIAELTPIPVFIRRNVGWWNLPLLLQAATMILGALSFLIPAAWSVAVRLRPGPEGAAEDVAPPARGKAGRGKGGAKAAKKPAGSAASKEVVGPGWRPSLFRLLLFAAFSALSWQATRNSHQFAAVVGAVTAWNFGEWAAAVRRRRRSRDPESESPGTVPRMFVLGCLVAVFLAVVSGQFYAWTGERRTVGLDEEPLWYPHEAVRFAGGAGMPERFVSFHDGYAGLYEYYHGPDRKVFVDARLEVIGPDLYERYLNLKRHIVNDEDDTAWTRELDSLGRPAILAGHANNAQLGAMLLRNSHWRCVWFDPVAAVFVHDSFREAVSAHQVDFAERHFHPDPSTEPRGLSALRASAGAAWNYANTLQATSRPDLARPLVLAGLGHARRVQQADPDSPDGWKLLGELETTREPAEAGQGPRFRLSFDPVFDLSTARATYAFRRALEAAPDDFMTLLLLAREYSAGGLNEAALPLMERLVAHHPINVEQTMVQAGVEAGLGRIRQQLGGEPPSSWENLSELDRIVSDMLASGRAGTAADLLERAYPADSLPWEIADRLATLRLHLGEPAKARRAWSRGMPAPHPGRREARLALTFLVEGSFEEARKAFREALRADPGLFEAHYGLAVLEEDAGRASEALGEAREALRSAHGDVAASAARLIIGSVAPYAPAPAHSASKIGDAPG